MKQMRRYFLLISALVLICTACPAAASAAVKVKLKEQAFTEIAAMIAVDPFESEVTLEGTVLTMGPQTSAVLR